MCTYGCIFFSSIFICPPFPTITTAKGHTPILRLRDFYYLTALSTTKSPTHRLSFYSFCFGMLPVQPLAVGRAELRPLVCCASYADDLAAVQTAKRPQHLSFGRGGIIINRTMPVRPQPTGCTAIFLRYPDSGKFLAANWTGCGPVHDAAARTISLRHERCFQKKVRKKDSLHRSSVCCLPYVSITRYTYPCVCACEKILCFNPYPPPVYTSFTAPFHANTTLFRFHFALIFSPPLQS